jgi:hypothetical protein
MGSFSEVTLAFTFTPGTPAGVLGAFAAWRVGDGAPALPALEQSLPADELERLDWR